MLDVLLRFIFDYFFFIAIFVCPVLVFWGRWSIIEKNKEQLPPYLYEEAKRVGWNNAIAGVGFIIAIFVFSYFIYFLSVKR
jgi:hypothetical protein